MPAAATTYVSGTLTGNIVWQYSGQPYQLTGDTTLAQGATLTILAATRVEGYGKYTFTVAGNLLVQGQNGWPVWFTGEPWPSPGAWKGVVFTPTATATVSYAHFNVGVDNVTVTGCSPTFSNCWFENASRDNFVLNGGAATFTNCSFWHAGRDGLVARNAARLTATNCAFGNNGRRGLWAETYDVAGSVTGSSFTGNVDYPIYLKSTSLGMLGDGLTFSGNTVPEIGVSCTPSTDVPASVIWRAYSAPYNLNVDANQSLVIAKGATLDLWGPTTLYCRKLEVKGNLRVGRPGHPEVLLRGPTLSPGCWEGIVASSGSYTELYYSTLQHAVTGLSTTGGRVAAYYSTLTGCSYDGLYANTSPSWLNLIGSTFSNNARNGLRTGTGVTGTVQDCRFTGNSSYPVYLLAAGAGMLSTGNYYRGNGKQAIGVSCSLSSDVTASATWKLQCLPFDLTANAAGTMLQVASGATLTLEPGVIVLGGGLEISGGLSASGRAASPIEFRPAGALTPGAWEGLTFLSGSTGNLTSCVLSYATVAVNCSSASPRLQRCVLRQCSVAGLQALGTAAPLLYNCQVSENRGDGVLIAGTAAPRLGDLGNGDPSDDGTNAFFSNGAYDIRNTTALALPVQNNWWGTDSQSEISLRVLDSRDSSSYGLLTTSPLVSITANPAPTLTWTGETGLTSDGVDPDLGTPSSSFRFRVKYRDAAGEAPRFVRVHLLDNGVPYPGSPFMLKASGANFVTGVIYSLSQRLVAGRRYSYYFEASDSIQLARGDPTGLLSGPLVNTVPTLAWTAETGYEADGVNPDSGVAGTSFSFRVRYTDREGDAPTSTVLYLLRNGVALPGSPFPLTWTSGDPLSGAIYRYTTSLGAGTYQYRFAANDGLQDATGAPAALLSGPGILGPAALLGSLWGAQAPAGNVEIRCSLLAPCNLNLRVLNIAGREVARLAQGLACEAGERVLLWSARGNRGTRLPGGTYLLEVEAEGERGWTNRRIVPLNLR